MRPDTKNNPALFFTILGCAYFLTFAMFLGKIEGLNLLALRVMAHGAVVRLRGVAPTQATRNQVTRGGCSALTLATGALSAEAKSKFGGKRDKTKTWSPGPSQ